MRGAALLAWGAWCARPCLLADLATKAWTLPTRPSSNALLYLPPSALPTQCSIDLKSNVLRFDSTGAALPFLVRPPAALPALLPSPMQGRSKRAALPLVDPPRSPWFTPC